MQLKNKEILPCGCVIGTSLKNEFVIQPCSFECPTYNEAIKLSKERGNTVNYKYGEIQ